METFTLPERNKYLRYSAYVKLKNEVIKRCEIDGRRRYASVVFKSITLNSADVIVHQCPIINMSVDDNVTMLINKQLEMKSFEDFKRYVAEAASSFIMEFSKVEGPTIAELDDAAERVIQSVVSDLLLV